MRIHRAVLAAVLSALSLIVVRAALDEDRVAKSRPAASPKPSSDCCIDAVESNFPMTPVSDRGTNCPSSEVPYGTENSFDLQAGRVEIHFYDAALGRSGTFVLEVEDPACYAYPATRAVLFSELVMALQIDPSSSGEETRACGSLRRSVRVGKLRLGDRVFDLTAARPYIREVCPYS